MKLVSPVSTLLGGVTPEGMVCGVDGVCAPVGSAPVDGAGTDSSTVVSTGDSSTGDSSTEVSSTGDEN